MPGADAHEPDSPNAAPARRPLPVAWLPLTPRGVAAFAWAPARRLGQVQLATAVLVAGTIGWFLLAVWFPVIRQAIQRLPDTGEIRKQLLLPAMPEGTLAESRFLAIVVDSQGRNAVVDTVADLRVRFESRRVQFCSLLGFLDFSYPQGYSIPFNRPEIQPWWDAWEPFILFSAALATIALLFAIWGVVGALYCPVVLVIAWLGRRDVTPAGSWKLAMAALIPGAVLWTLGFVFYGVEFLDLVRLAVVGALHVVTGWFYLVAGTLVLPRRAESGSPEPNPFAERPPNAG